MKIPGFIKNNLLLKITSLNSIGVSIRLVLSLLTQKFIAIVLGPEGVAQIGNIRNLFPMIESFSTLGVFNGIVKYVAEFKEDKKELDRLFSTVYVYSLLASLITFLILFFGSTYLSELLFRTDEYSNIIKALAVSVPFIALNRIFNGVVNGISAYKYFVTINLISYTCSVFLLVFMICVNNINGALFAIAITPFIQFVIVIYFYLRVTKDYIQFKKIHFSIPYKKELLAFTIMSLASTFLGNFVELNLRGSLTTKISEVDAGYWTGMTNISKQYLMFMSAILTLYVIPKFATIKDSVAFRKEVFSIYKTVLPIFAIGMFVIFFTREWIILIAKTEAFLGMKPLFKWQLLGDFVKLASIIIAHQFLAKKMVKQFIFTEIFSLISFYLIAMYLIKSMGAEGVVLAHFIRYVLYFIMVVLVLRKHIFGKHIIKG